MCILFEKEMCQLIHTAFLWGGGHMGVQACLNGQPHEHAELGLILAIRRSLINTMHLATMWAEVMEIHKPPSVQKSILSLSEAYMKLPNCSN